jgi:hypothetical protein
LKKKRRTEKESPKKDEREGNEITEVYSCLLVD